VEELQGRFDGVQCCESGGSSEIPGIIEVEEAGEVRVGGGRSQHFALREGDPLVEEVCRLFHIEHERFLDLLSGLRSALKDLTES